MKSREKKKVQVVIMARRPQKQVLLLQTNKQRGCFWQNVTGGVKKGESFKAAAARELQEETQFQNIKQFIPLDLAFQFYREHNNTHYTEQSFLALLDFSIKPKLDTKEHQDFKWIPLGEVTSHHYEYTSNFEAYEKALDSLSTHPAHPR